MQLAYGDKGYNNQCKPIRLTKQSLDFLSEFSIRLLDTTLKDPPLFSRTGQ